MKVIYVEGIRYKDKKLRSIEGLMGCTGIVYYHKVCDKGGEYWTYVSDCENLDYSVMENLEDLECTEVEIKIGGLWYEVRETLLGIEGYRGNFVVVELEPTVALGFQKSVRCWCWGAGLVLEELSCDSEKAEDLCVIEITSVVEYERVIEFAYSTKAKIFDMRGLGFDVLGLVSGKSDGVYWLVGDVGLEGLVELGGVKLYGMRGNEQEHLKGAVEYVIGVYEKERLKV